MLPSWSRKLSIPVLASAVIVSLAVPGTTAAAPEGAPPAPSVVAGTVAEPALLFGWAHIGAGLPVEGARVVLVTRKGTRIKVPAALTGTRGEFSLDVEGVDLPRGTMAVTRGGTVQGREFTGRLRFVLDVGHRKAMLHISPATTMAAVWLSRNPGTSRNQAMHRARIALGVVGHSIEEGVRLGTAPLSGRSLWRAIQRQGFPRWLAAQVARMDSRSTTDLRSESIPVAGQGAGSTAAGLLWNAVVAAAESCDPSSSSIPGVGYLASSLADTGLVSQDPSCGELKEILNDLEQIEQGITQIETALQTASNEIFAVGALIKVDALSNARSQLQYNVLSPITVGQAAYTFLTNSAQTAVDRLGIPLGEILTSTDDTVTGDSNVKQLRANAQNVLSPAGALGTGFATAVTSLTAPSTVTDTTGGIDKGVLHLTWEAIRTLSPFIDAEQLALYNQVVDYLRQVNAHAAALSIDIARSTNLTSAQITSTIIGPWKLPDSYFDGVSTELLPCPSVDDTLDGRCEPLTVADATGATMAWAHVAPVLDPATGLLWSAVCAEANMALDACEATGTMSYTRGNGRVTPYWFDTPVRMTWGEGGADGGAFTRPTSTQIKSLAEVAAANGQQSSAVTGWIAKQSPVFATVASAPIASNLIGFDCGWASPTDPFSGKPLKDIEAYFICPATEICKDGFKDPFAGPDLGPGSCFGLQGAGYKVAIDLADKSHRIGWALPTAPTTLPLADQPGSPPNYIDSQVVLWDWAGFGCGYDEAKPPPTTGSCYPYTMSAHTAPLAVRSVDASRYQVASWVLAN